MERAWTVSQLNEYVRRTLASDPMLRGVRLTGEISNFKRHSAGHLYFSLKDDAARVACVMFRSAAAGLSVVPRDGLRVVATGSAALYPAAGQYQFYVDSLRENGVGDLYAAFERLKARLAAEGLFDAGLKKPLPLLPRAVGIVTSATGAVLHDIQQVAARRHPGIPLVLMPAAVQGEGAAAQIVAALQALDKRPEIEVIIVGRGGGSLEELWPFNEEIVARAIFACKTPVVSAVGHETDFTIADFVADLRAATPSQAAELVVPRLSELREALDAYAHRLRRAQGQRLKLLRHRLNTLAARLGAQQPVRRLSQQRAKADALLGLLAARVEGVLAAKRLRLAGARGRMEALAPQRVLERGYAVVTDDVGRVLTDAAAARAGQKIGVQLLKGALGAQIMEVRDGGEEKTRVL
ncbi:MAG: exodeoxyribonuclease VII large subunit [Oscillospiraceae bacterium]|nr:exodeoxyribonuclease VII large subunit [Oscillospiraceae bacterium]